MLKEIAEKYSEDEVSVHVVWMPMVPGDDEQAARSSAKMYGGHAVHQYYDAQRIVGLAYRAEVFANCLRDAIGVMPKDHPLYADLTEWASTPRGEGPLWDAVLFYPPSVEWREEMPRPAAWSKQVGFFGSDAGPITGMFFRNSCTEPPTESDWHVEVRNAMNGLVENREASVVREMQIELLSFPGCPNTPSIRENLQTALASLDLDAKTTEVNLQSLKAADRRRGWGAPTILLNGRDLMGSSQPTSRTLSCRVYPHGIPSAEEIARRIAGEKTGSDQAEQTRQIVFSVNGFT